MELESSARRLSLVEESEEEMGKITKQRNEKLRAQGIEETEKESDKRKKKRNEVDRAESRVMCRNVIEVKGQLDRHCSITSLVPRLSNYCGGGIIKILPAIIREPGYEATVSHTQRDQLVPCVQ